jgi:hypothetical protein
MAENADKNSPEEIRPEGGAPQESPSGPVAAASETAEKAHSPEQQASPAAPVPPRQSKRWELIVAVSVALVAMTGAVLTYVSIQQESAAVEADRQSVVETMLIQNQRVFAETQARGFGIFAARYQQLMAEASALSATDPDQAGLLRVDAAGFAVPGVTQYLTGTGATARYNFPAALQGALTVDEEATIPPDQPGRTARLADHDRLVSGRIAAGVVGLLVVVVLLTLTRLFTAERLRRGLFSVAVIGYMAAVIAAVVQFA